MANCILVRGNITKSSISKLEYARRSACAHLNPATDYSPHGKQFSDSLFEESGKTDMLKNLLSANNYHWP